MSHIWPKIKKSAVLPLGFLVLCSGFLVGCATANRAAPGATVWEHVAYSEAGDVASRTVLTVTQNEDPESGSRMELTPEGGLTVDWGRSFFSAPPRLAHVEKSLAGAGILCLIAAALLAGVGKHYRLAGIAGLCGLLLIGVAATIDRYAWAYGLAILGLGAGVSWLAWSSYKAGSQNPFVVPSKPQPPPQDDFSDVPF